VDDFFTRAVPAPGGGPDDTTTAHPPTAAAAAAATAATAAMPPAEAATAAASALARRPSFVGSMATLSNLSSDAAEGPSVVPAARPLPPPVVAVAVDTGALAAASADFEDDGVTGEGAARGALQYHRDSHDVDHSLEEQVPSPFYCLAPV